MAIPNVAIQSFEQVAQSRLSVSSQTQARTENTEGPDGELTSRQERQAQLNTSILQSHVSIGSQDDPASLLFKTALDAINKELEPTLGKNAAQKAFDSGIDFSPEATAERIVNFATSFFPLYQQNHEGEGTLESQLDDFLALVGGGVEKGFGEAKDILEGLNVFEGEVEENANSTRDLIYEGFDRFRQGVLEANGISTEQSTAQATEQAATIQ